MASARFAALLSSATLALLVVSVAAKPTSPLSSRILGGEDADTGAFPYAASVRLDTVHACGGTIIDDRHILTAAHCVVGQDHAAYHVGRMSVRVGSTNQFSGGKIVYVQSVTIHPEYTSFKNDVAVLTLTSALGWTEKIRSIELATEEPPVGASVVVAGWGTQSSGSAPYKLQHTSFTVASDAVCTDAFDSADESNICLAHPVKEGTCSGDAGNGAVYENKLVAIASFVVGTCGSIYPDVFANVPHFASWIQSVVA